MDLAVNNQVYDTLGERWYTADDDPIALLRAQSRLLGPWVAEVISQKFLEKKSCRVLDLGCGGGFISNRLAQLGHQVTGIDLSVESLEIARKHDLTRSVKYLSGSADHLPFEADSFDVVTAMDFLEHVENPQEVIQQVSRVLSPQGLFFFHTFNRHLLSYLVVIKGVEWLVKNTPPRMHLLRLFIKPKELKQYCETANLDVQQILGTRPNLLRKDIFSVLLSKTVPKDFSFSFAGLPILGYSGFALKQDVL